MATGKARVEAARQWIHDTADRVRWFPLLLVRITVGVVFIQSGWGKLHSLAKVTDFFTSLKIPAPAFQAQLVATTEFVGGTLVLVGLFARLAAVPLMFTMVVAILTAKADDLKGFGDLFGFSEYDYLVFFLVIAVMGPGALSIDALLARLLKLEKGQAPGRTLVLASRAVAAVAVVGLLAFTAWGAFSTHAG